MEIHNIRLKAFAQEADAKQAKAILDGYVSNVSERILPPEAEGGVFTHPLVELQGSAEKKGEAGIIWDKIWSGLSDYDRDRIVSEADKRVDDDCNLYLRLSKEGLSMGEFILQSKDSVHVKVKLAVYPARKDKAVEALKTLKSSN